MGGTGPSPHAPRRRVLRLRRRGTPPLTLRLLFWWLVVCGWCWVGWVVGFFGLGGGWVVDFGFLCVYYWGVGGCCSCWVVLGCLVGRSRSGVSDLEVVESCVA